MNESVVWTLVAGSLALAPAITAAEPAAAATFGEGNPEIRSMSALAFGPDGVLFVGDGKAGAVYAVDVGDARPRGANEPVVVQDVEGKVAALLGTRPDDIVVHDLAVHPVSQKIYLSVSRSRAKWDSSWLLPNDLGDAQILLRVDADGSFAEVPLEGVRYAKAALPNPVDASKAHPWKQGISMRADTVTDLAYHDGVLYVAGLSNEEFASTMWRVPYPFASEASATTLEIFHGAHGEYETQAPIRTFVPYAFGTETQLLAAYLCTPLVTFPLADLQNGAHVKGRTVAEFGSGNYPLDMLVYSKDGEDRLLIANSNLPFMIVRTADVAAFPGGITTMPQTYTAGVVYEPRSGTGVQQMDRLNAEHAVVLKRQPGGKLVLESVPFARF